MIALLALLCCAPALAGETVGAPVAAEPVEAPPIVSIVPLDGPPGTSSRDMSVVVRGLAAAMGREGRVVVVSGASLVDRLTTGKQRQLQEARDAFSEGQLMMQEGDPDIGMAFLAEAVSAHERAGSAVARREEMADAAFILAKALLAVGREEEARSALTRALRLLPDYLDTQTEAADPTLRALARQVETDLLERPPQRLSAAGAAALGADLQTDRIVHGYVRDGKLVLSVFDGSSRLWTGAWPFEARRVGDPWYDDVAAEIIAASLGEPSPADAPPPAPPPESPVPAPPDEGGNRGVGLALGVTAGVLAVGAATTAVALTRPRQAPPDAWELRVRIGQ